MIFPPPRKSIWNSARSCHLENLHTEPHKYIILFPRLAIKKLASMSPASAFETMLFLFNVPVKRRQVRWQRASCVGKYIGEANANSSYSPGFGSPNIIWHAPERPYKQGSENLHWCPENNGSFCDENYCHFVLKWRPFIKRCLEALQIIQHRKQE